MKASKQPDLNRVVFREVLKVRAVTRVTKFAISEKARSAMFRGIRDGRRSHVYAFLAATVAQF
jgi:hypothetical protein